ncbi:MAG: hypothetical protein IT373_25385 [Polyangiaceae bacterium]|nr:hypothetical protein [Polyangiaceae bacterium]
MTDEPMLPFDDPILAEFRVFDAENPHIWEHFERFTLMAIRAGRTRYSSDAILHRIRWHLDVDTKSDDGFKVNDHWTRCYSRKWSETHPEYANFFERRAIRARL